MEWISVNDETRRPKDQEDVLAVIQDGLTKPWITIVTCVDVNEGKDYGFFHPDDWWIGNNVIYWMALPALPKEVS